MPPSIREGSLALGATQWQTIWKQVLPGSIAGIATGVILALSRAIGETAPLLVIGAAVSSRFNPDGARSQRQLHRAADSDLRLDAGPESRVHLARGRRDRRADGDSAPHELRGHLAAQPIRAEVVSDDMPEKTEAPASTEHVHAAAASALPREHARRRRSRPARPIFDVRDVERLLRHAQGRGGREPRAAAPADHRADRPVGLRQVDVHPLPEPDERPDPVRARGRLDRLPRPGPLRARTSTRCRCASGSGWCSRSRTRSRSRSTTTSPSARGCSAMKGDMDEIVERALRRGARLGRGQGPPEDERVRHVRRPAAAAVHRARAGHGAGRAADGRAVLRARPDLHGPHRGPDDGAQGDATRS